MPVFGFIYRFAGVTSSGGSGWYLPRVAIIAVVYSIPDPSAFGDVPFRAGRGR